MGICYTEISEINTQINGDTHDMSFKNSGLYWGWGEEKKMNQQYDLCFFDDFGQLVTVNLNRFKKPEVSVGRDASCADIVLNFESISRVHGRFLLQADGLYYQDSDSLNGTSVVDNMRGVKLHHTEKKVQVTESSFFKIGTEDKFFLFFVRKHQADRGWKKIALNEKPLSIGRNSGNDVVLRHPSVSKRHARVGMHEKRPQVQDMNSHNGTRVNGGYIHGVVPLQDYDVIEILDYQMIYCQGMLYYLTSVEGVHLVVENLNKSVNNGQKKLLQHINLEIKSNDFVAIIGGSGAGKTTLMNAISGFDQQCSGRIYFSGNDLKKNFNHLKELIGYVPQQEIIYENLTLHNMLYYTAKMKLPSDMDKKEIEARIVEVLKMVELSQHASTYIRKLSGGQKKRASIAVELLADPKLFFLDEPTSGLDPGTEENLMLLLNHLSKTRDKTTIIVTHTTQNLHLCDKVVFMGPGGYLCFYGSVEQAKMFFQTDSLVSIYNLIAKDPVMWAKQFDKIMREERQQADERPEAMRKVRRKKTANMRQMGVLTRRYAELIWNDKTRLAILLLQPVIIGILLKLVSNDEVFSVFEDTQTMLFSLSCASIWIGLFNSIQEICKERSILKREYMANLRLPLYTLSKFIIQFVLAAAQAALLTTVFAISQGEYPKGIWLDSYVLEIFTAVLLTILASMSMGLLISAVVKTGDKAMTLAPFVLIVQLLFSGILFKLEDAAKYIAYLTVSKWSVESMGSILDLNSLTLRMQKEIPTLEHKAQDIYEHAGSHVMCRWGVLMAMTLVLITFTTILLTQVKKDQR